MELGVRLNLLCSRVDEVMPAVQSFLDGFGQALGDAREAMNTFLQAFQPALDTASVAHQANLQAEEAKVVISARQYPTLFEIFFFLWQFTACLHFANANLRSRALHNIPSQTKTAQ